MRQLEQWGWQWSRWYKGERGEYWFLAQALGIVVFFLLPVHPVISSLAWPLPVKWGFSGVAALMGLVAVVFIGKGLLDLGQSLTPLPYPREDGQLVTSGIYSVVRHPLYSGLCLAMGAWVLATLSWPHLLWGAIVVAILLRKAHLEEQWLERKYPEYPDYRRQVKQLIPWIW